MASGILSPYFFMKTLLLFLISINVKIIMTAVVRVSELLIWKWPEDVINIPCSLWIFIVKSELGARVIS